MQEIKSVINPILTLEYMVMKMKTNILTENQQK